MLSSLCLHIFFLFFASVFTETLLPSSSSPIIQEISTRGAETNYEFYFQNPTEINSNANIRIIFPTQFNNPVILNQITPECYLYQNSVYSKVSCFKDSYYSYSIKVLCNKLDSSVKKLVIGPIINPSLDESSGAFKFYTLYEDGIVDMNENFGFVTFSNSPSKFFLNFLNNLKHSSNEIGIYHSPFNFIHEPRLLLHPPIFHFKSLILR